MLDKHPKIQSWLETCKSHITDYEESNHRGAVMFGQWAQSMVAKLA